MEEWRDIPGFEGYYEASNLGRIRRRSYNIFYIDHRVKRTGIHLVKARHLKRDKHERVDLRKKGLGKTFCVHVLIARAFPEICGEWFPGCHVHHKDFNPRNNTPENLIVLSAREHLQYHYQFQSDSFKKPSDKRSKSISKALTGRRNTYKHIPILQYSLNGDFIKEWECISDVSNAGFSPGNICWCCKGKLKTAYGYIWKYK